MARVAQLFVEDESSPGTLIALAADDVLDFDADGTSITEGVGQNIKRRSTRSHLDRLAPLPPPGKFWNVVISKEIKAGAVSTEGTGTDCHDLFLASGLSVTHVASTSDAFTLVDNPNAAATQSACSVLLEEDGGNEYTAAGCNFGFEMSWSNDEAVNIVFTGIGKYAVPTTAALLGSVSTDYFTGSPMVVLDVAGNNPFQFHSYDMIVRSGSLSSGLSVEPRPHMGLSTSFNYAWPGLITRGADSHVSGSFEVEAVTETAFTAWARYAAATAAAGQIIFSDGTQFMTIDLQNVVFEAPQPTGTDLRLWTLDWTASRKVVATITPSLTITFT